MEITREEYLKAKQIVEEYKNNINPSNFEKTPCYIFYTNERFCRPQVTTDEDIKNYLEDVYNYRIGTLLTLKKI